MVHEFIYEFRGTNVPDKAIALDSNQDFCISRIGRAYNSVLKASSYSQILHRTCCRITLFFP